MDASYTVMPSILSITLIFFLTRSAYEDNQPKAYVSKLKKNSNMFLVHEIWKIVAFNPLFLKRVFFVFHF